jgi:hypothetical protein
VSATTNLSGVFTVTDDNPFVVWRIKNPNGYASGNYTRAQFIEERPGRTSVSEIQYSSGSANAWMLLTGTGNDLRTEKRTVAISGQSRSETVEILNVQNEATYKALEQYRQYPWGWELTNVVSKPAGNGLTNSFTYYEDSNDPVSYRKLKDRWRPGGQWERWYYANDRLCPGWTSQFGNDADFPSDMSTYYAEIRVVPWKDGCASPDNATLNNTVQEFTIHASLDSAHRPSRLFEHFHGNPGDPVNMIYYRSEADGADGGIVGNMSYEYSNKGGKWQKTARHYNPGNYLHDMLSTVTDTVARQENYQYYKGDFSWNDFGFVKNESTGTDIKSLLTHATSSNTGLSQHDVYPNTSYQFWYALNEPDAALQLDGFVHAGKSTQEIGIHRQGNLIYKETLAMESVESTCNAPVFLPVERQILSYDSLGHLVQVVWQDANNANVSRTTYQASWRGRKIATASCWSGRSMKPAKKPFMPMIPSKD